ncbi:multidrug transporter [Oceanicola sp. 22II-s10i]|uniref:S49 family peptidase n=1 Tax=Oceanicola sp. 22II-s10i TaxID=1317116 RepID=UPI000B52598E|nr:S49 family peptidase [Oceanicola sp. 22II-s10i]OWU85551.1 multidrug transporter [Oceanicola sp. 22II-s10i]
MLERLPFTKKHPTVAVIRLHGTISAGPRGPINDAILGPVIERAFRKGKPAAVALAINSPGGSPVQSSLISARIRRLSAEKNVPVYAFVEDVAASGGYWLACAADEIHADDSSIVGSIGVIAASFGAHVLLARQGVERRVHTAGRSKSMLDPFRPENPEDVEKLQALLGDIHTSFIDHVKSRRGDKLKPEVPLFEGDIWLARRAKELGLIDGIDHITPFMRRKFGEKVRFRRYGVKRGLFTRFTSAAFGGALAEIEDRAAFARFGL